MIKKIITLILQAGSPRRTMIEDGCTRAQLLRGGLQEGPSGAWGHRWPVSGFSGRLLSPFLGTEALRRASHGLDSAGRSWGLETTGQGAGLQPGPVLQSGVSPAPWEHFTQNAWLRQQMKLLPSGLAEDLSHLVLPACRQSSGAGRPGG